MNGLATPIPTLYNSLLFRSRLEARWAVFFDTLGIEYLYEPEGYVLKPPPPSEEEPIYYLPDFWLPKQNCWIEIKPVSPSDEEEDKATRLAYGSNKDVYIFWGQIPNPDTIADSGPSESDSAFAHFAGGLGWDNHHVWCQCPKCGLLGIQFDARAGRLPCNCVPNEDKGYNGASPALLDAYRRARTAQFEYGVRHAKLP